MTVAINTIKISDTNLTITYTGGDPAPPKPSGYNCNNNKCEESKSGAGTFNTIDECNSKCKKSTLPVCNIHNSELNGYECPNCIEIDTQKLVNLINTEPYKSDRLKLTGIDSIELMKQIGKTKDGTANITINSFFSVKELAKVWIVATDGYTWKPSPTSSTTFKGGVPTCAQSVAVAGFEGGAQAGPSNLIINDKSCVNPADSSPLDRCDPSFNFGFCKEGNSCSNGGYWQISNAVTKDIWTEQFPSNSSLACVSKDINNFNLKNPFCSAIVSLIWAGSGYMNNKKYVSSLDTNKECLDPQNNFIQCSADELWCSRRNPNCSIGPFCHDSQAWNSPVCTTLFRTGKKGTSCNQDLKDKMNLFSFCKIALNATEDAVNELTSAGYTFINGTSADDTEGYKDFVNTCNLVDDSWVNGNDNYTCPPINGSPQPSNAPSCS